MTKEELIQEIRKYHEERCKNGVTVFINNSDDDENDCIEIFDGIKEKCKASEEEEALRAVAVLLLIAMKNDSFGRALDILCDNRSKIIKALIKNGAK